MAPSKLGLMIHGDGSSKPLPQYQSQNHGIHPNFGGIAVSPAGGGSGVSSRTEFVAVTDARGREPDPDMNEKRLRPFLRLTFRISSWKSRMKRNDCINEMETMVEKLEAQVAILSPQLTQIQGKKRLLQLENELMRQKKTTIEEHFNLKQAETGTYQIEQLHRLKQLFEMLLQLKQEWMAASASGQVDHIPYQGSYQAYQLMVQQQIVNPNFSQPNGLEDTENPGIMPVSELDQILPFQPYPFPSK